MTKTMLPQNKTQKNTFDILTDKNKCVISRTFRILYEAIKD